MTDECPACHQEVSVLSVKSGKYVRSLHYTLDSNQATPRPVACAGGGTKLTIPTDEEIEQAVNGLKEIRDDLT